MTIIVMAEVERQQVGFHLGFGCMVDSFCVSAKHQACCAALIALLKLINTLVLQHPTQFHPGQVFPQQSRWKYQYWQEMPPEQKITFSYPKLGSWIWIFTSNWFKNAFPNIVKSTLSGVSPCNINQTGSKQKLPLTTCFLAPEIPPFHCSWF